MQTRLLQILIIGASFSLACLLWFNEYYRIAAVPSFPGLRRFPDGRDFSQWTGDDSKALMKVS